MNSILILQKIKSKIILEKDIIVLRTFLTNTFADLRQ